MSRLFRLLTSAFFPHFAVEPNVTRASSPLLGCQGTGSARLVRGRWCGGHEGLTRPLYQVSQSIRARIRLSCHLLNLGHLTDQIAHFIPSSTATAATPWMFRIRSASAPKNALKLIFTLTPTNKQRSPHCRNWSVPCEVRLCQHWRQ